MPNYIKGYHTQEHRPNDPFLKEPIFCNDKNVWLGAGYYFWTEEYFAHKWGEKHKSKNTEAYDIYHADVDVENCLDLSRDDVFDLICTFCDAFYEKNRHKNRFNKGEIWAYLFKNYNDFFSDIEVISFYDYPNMGKNEMSKPKDFFKKRIQLSVLHKKSFSNFSLHKPNNKTIKNKVQLWP